MNAAETTANRIKQVLLLEGCSAVGIADAEPLTDAIEHYQQWIGSGNHGTMAWMERRREERADVGLLLPGAKSVIVTAWNYHTEHGHQPSDVGKVSRYAWGDDYHDVIPPKLDAAIEVLRNEYPGHEFKRYVDTGPVLEKEWAVRAGLGWQGRHSNVIRRDIGSWFFLGVIITTLDAKADAPMMDFCGTCTACIEACPTNAITDNRSVDSRKCLSYWTIEVKPDVELDQEIEKGLDGWLYGCDTCQDVCPWNRFEQPCNEPRFEPRESQTVIQPSYIVNLSPEEFRSRFTKSPMKRPKLAGLQRTASALLRNINRTDEEEE